MGEKWVCLKIVNAAKEILISPRGPCEQWGRQQNLESYLIMLSLEIGGIFRQPPVVSHFVW